MSPYFLSESKMKKKVLFHKDGYLNGELAYEAGKVYEIDDTLGSATRWLVRGAEFVEDSAEVGPKAEAEETVANEESKEDNKKVKKAKGL